MPSWPLIFGLRQWHQCLLHFPTLVDGECRPEPSSKKMKCIWRWPNCPEQRCPLVDNNAQSRNRPPTIASRREQLWSFAPPEKWFYYKIKKKYIWGFWLSHLWVCRRIPMSLRLWFQNCSTFCIIPITDYLDARCNRRLTDFRVNRIKIWHFGFGKQSGIYLLKIQTVCEPSKKNIRFFRHFLFEYCSKLLIRINSNNSVSRMKLYLRSLLNNFNPSLFYSFPVSTSSVDN